MIRRPIHVGVVQATPSLFDRRGTLEIIDQWLSEAKKEGCELILFPESFIPCYPRGLDFDAVVGQRSPKSKELWQRYWDQSLEIGSKDFIKLSEIIASHGIMCAIGVTERDATGGSLFCSLMYFDQTGTLLGTHRKLKPTGLERYIWAEGSGKDLVTLSTNNGIIGGLICWENYMPGARWAMYQKGVDIYLAPTADARPSWQSSMIHIAREGRCFVLSANQFVSSNDYPEDIQNEVSSEATCAGGSIIVDPNGKVLAGPLWQQEGLLTATLDPEIQIGSKLEFDVVGHYARPDVFSFATLEQPDPVDVKFNKDHHEN